MPEDLKVRFNAVKSGSNLINYEELYFRLIHIRCVLLKEKMVLPSEDSRASRVRCCQTGKTAQPWEMILFLTNRCNLKCQICWQRWAEEEFGKVDFTNELSDERWLKLVDEGAELGVREWAIVGGGEPMVRGDLVIRLAERITFHGMDLAIHTNGALFKEGQIERLAEIAPSSIVFSLDGPTSEINDQIRSKGSFEKATAAMRRFSEIKQESGSKNPKIAMACVLTSTNIDKIEQMIDLYLDLGCDGGLGLAALAVQGTICKEFELNDEQNSKLEEILNRAVAYASETGIKHNFYTVLDTGSAPRVTDKTCSDSCGFSSCMCYEPWMAMMVQTDGRVGPCCVAYDEQADSIRDKSLEEVWTGPYFEELRQRILDNDLMDYCRFCPSHVMARTDGLRGELELLRWNHLGPLEKSRELSVRFWSNLCNRGIRQTLKRGREWSKIHLGQKKG